MYETLDKAMFKGEMFLLVKGPDGFGIHKMVSMCISESVKLSPKKLLKYKKTFESPSAWNRKSSVKISDDGQLTDVQVAKFEKPLFFGKGFRISIYMPVY